MKIELVNCVELVAENPVIWHDKSKKGNSLLIRTSTLEEAESIKKILEKTLEDGGKA